MALEVIGAGWSRTGTFSLRSALNQLGWGPCYHFQDVFERPDHHALWRLAAAGGLADWGALLAGYRSVTDTPACLFWRELVASYPSAKVILSVRDPSQWYASMRSTVVETMRRAEPESGPAGAALSLSRELVLEGFFQGRFDDEATALALFEAHNAAVRAAVPSERLLVYEVSQGWQPLCEFLGTAVPPAPFPHTNRRAQFRERVGLEPAG